MNLRSEFRVVTGKFLLVNLSSLARELYYACILAALTWWYWVKIYIIFCIFLYPSNSSSFECVCSTWRQKVATISSLSRARGQYFSITVSQPLSAFFLPHSATFCWARFGLFCPHPSRENLVVPCLRRRNKSWGGGEPREYIYISLTMLKKNIIC